MLEGAAVAALLLAILAGIGDWRRRRRSDPDRVGMIDWRTLQFVALVAAAICVAVAWAR
jgi:hypothetical protein